MDKTFKNMLYFFVSVVLAKIFGMLSSFFIAKFLLPADYGVWMTLLLIFSYAPLAYLGTSEALIKQYPYYLGRGDVNGADIVEKGVLGSMALSALMLIIIGFTFHFVYLEKSFIPFLFLIRIMFVASAINCFSNFFYNRFTAHQNFKYVSILESLDGILSFFILAFCAWLWGITGIVIGFLFKVIVTLAYSWYLNKFQYGKLRFSFNGKLMWNLIKIGFPITTVWWIYNLQTSSDRIISMYMLGKEPTGFYSLGTSIVSAIILIPMVVGRVLYPQINEEVGKASDQKNIFLYVLKPTQTLSIILPCFISFLILIAPFIYNNLLPKYGPGLKSVQILLLGAFFICLVRNGVNYLVAINKQNQVMVYVIISFLLNVILGVAFVKIGFNIEGIALATGLSSFVLETLIMLSVFRNLGYQVGERFKQLSIIYLPFFIMLPFLSGVMFILQKLNQKISIYSLFLYIILLIFYFIILKKTPFLTSSIDGLFLLCRKHLPIINRYM